MINHVISYIYYILLIIPQKYTHCPLIQDLRFNQDFLYNILYSDRLNWKDINN